MSLRVILPAALLFAAAPAAAEEVVAEYRGSTSRNTPEFEVQAPWILDWRVSPDIAAYEWAIDVSLEAAGLGVHEGRVFMTKSSGNARPQRDGVRLFDKGGRFYFRVDASFTNWTLRVIELTEEEAAQYTPAGEEQGR